MATAPSSYSVYLLILLATMGLVMPYCAVADNLMYSGNSIYAGQALVEGNYVFTIQNDCNLVLYDTGRAIWSSGTYGRGTNCRLTMQRDANLVVYNGNGVAVWASNTARAQGNYVVIMQRDRNVVIYGGSIWATGTNRPGTPGVIITENVTQPATAAVVDVVVNAAAEPINRKIAMVTEN